MKIEVHETGFWVGGGPLVPWSAVVEVFAYKDDCFFYDRICVGFRTSGDGTWWRVDEENPGYQELLAALPDHFPGIRTDWFSEVAFPAFATNRTTLWGEPFPG